MSANILELVQPLPVLVELGIARIIAVDEPLPPGRYAIKASAEEPESGVEFGPTGWWWHNDCGDGIIVEQRPPDGGWNQKPAPLGCVVASCTITKCVPVVDYATCRAAITRPYPPHVCVWHSGHARLIESSDTGTDIDDQLPYSSFTPGRWALVITDVQPFSEGDKQ